MGHSLWQIAFRTSHRIKKDHQYVFFYLYILLFCRGRIAYFIPSVGDALILFLFLLYNYYTHTFIRLPVCLTCLSYLFVCLDLALGAHVAPLTAGGVTVVCSASVAWASTLGGFGSLTVGGSAGSSGGWGIATATATAD